MERHPLGPGPLVYAHRGDRTRAPDNTLEAYRLAVEAGADGIELDVRRTADGVLILSHDDRVPGHPPFIELGFDEVRRSLPLVPTFSEMLTTVPERVFLNVEIKNDPRDPDFDRERGIVDEVLAVIARDDEPGRVVLSSFDPEAVARARTIAPDVLRAQLITDPVDIAAGIPIAHEVEAAALNPPMHQIVSPDSIRTIHDAGLSTMVWGANDEAEVAALIAAGADVIITDDPSMARKLVDQP